MKTTRETLRAMRETIRRGPDRSSLYWWMVDHHADLIDEGVAAGRMPWRKLCRDFAAEGLTDGRGKAATPARAGKTWRDACVAVAAAAERTKPRRGKINRRHSRGRTLTGNRRSRIHRSPRRPWVIHARKRRRCPQTVRRWTRRRWGSSRLRNRRRN